MIASQLLLPGAMLEISNQIIIAGVADSLAEVVNHSSVSVKKYS